METDTVDLSLMCRTCKTVSDQMKNIFEALDPNNITEDNPRIDEMLMACASVQISFGDGLPTSMCIMCIESLKNAFQFKKQCESTDASLREYAKNEPGRSIKQELQHSVFMESLNTLDNLLNTNEQQSKDDSSISMNDTSTSSTDNKIEHCETDFIQLLDHNQILITCRECSKFFTTLDGLRSHKRTHTGDTFKCKQCDKEYTRKNHLERHETTHGKRKVHVCKICNKTLTRIEHLKRHMITHLREKPFNCKTCNRGFNRVEHLHNHIPRCKGDIVHVCPICNKAFTREDSLDVHKQQHNTTQLTLPTIDSLENIEEHYFEVDYDDSQNFSDNSDLDDCFEPHIEVTESIDDSKIDIDDIECLQSSTVDDGSSRDSTQLEGNLKKKKKIDSLEDVIDSDNDEKPLADLVTQVKTEKDKCNLNEENEVVEGGNDDGRDSSIDTSDEEYLPKKSATASPSSKKRGRPRKHPSKQKSGRRGRPRGSLARKRSKMDDDEYGDFPCTVCNEIFDKLSALDKHGKEAHPGLRIHKCNICGKNFNRQNHLKRHMTCHSEDKPYSCEICTRSFNRRDHLNQHQKLHEVTGDHPCDICEKPFNRLDHLIKHKASKHGIGEKATYSGEKKYNCEICHKGFTTEKYRDIHMKAHNGEKTFRCKVCEKTFLSKSHLTEHMKFHNENSKKFLCSECGQRFIRNDYLVIHMRRHRGEKPFKCRYCGKGFPRTTDLTVHERYHTGEKTHLCTVCGRGFGRAYNLTVHMRTHTGEKPYQCTYCEAAFAQGNDLKAHIRRHTGERFQCDLCTESFLMGYLLTQHKRTVHGLNVVSNIRRLKPVNKQENPDDPPPITIPLPKPVVPETLLFSNLLPAIQKQEKPDDVLTSGTGTSLALPLSKPMVPENFLHSINSLSAQLSFSQMHFNVPGQRPAV